MHINNEILLFFGSFNPIHIGHLAIANYLTEFYNFSELWFVITPQSPDKKSSSLIDFRTRQHLVELSIDTYPKFKTCDIEFYLPKPNYTVDTLAHLSEKFPNRTFSLLIGGDNLLSFHKWKNANVILENYKIYVYKRPNYAVSQFNNAHIRIIDAPMMQISSSFIRKAIRENKDIRFFLASKAYDYIIKQNLYR